MFRFAGLLGALMLLSACAGMNGQQQPPAATAQAPAGTGNAACAPNCAPPSEADVPYLGELDQNPMLRGILESHGCKPWGTYTAPDGRKMLRWHCDNVLPGATASATASSSATASARASAVATASPRPLHEGPPKDKHVRTKPRPQVVVSKSPGPEDCHIIVRVPPGYKASATCDPPKTVGSAQGTGTSPTPSQK